MHLAGGGAVECRRLVAMPEFLAFLRTALGDVLAAFVDNPMPSNVYDPAACVATRCPAAKAIERAADAVTIASAKELNGMVAVAETTLRYWYDPVCHLLAQKAANNVSSLVLRAIPWSPAVHSLFPVSYTHLTLPTILLV